MTILISRIARYSKKIQKGSGQYYQYAQRDHQQGHGNYPGSTPAKLTGQNAKYTERIQFCESEP
jgi:hypothetical protein